jgi:uncharacterized OB-fold protein
MTRRSLPALDDDNRAFWTGGAHGELLIHRCADCHYYVHPPTSYCPRCESRDVAPVAVSGLGRIESLTVNHKAWFAGQAVPYVVALVTIAEQDDVRLVANIVDCAVGDVCIGQDVAVRFEAAGDIWVPLFAPVSA